MTSARPSSLFDLANAAWDAGERKRAFKLFLAAAQSGEEDAFNSVGYFFDHGIGVKKDPNSAFAWYRRAALRGNLAGCLNLAVCYRNAGNLPRAKFWFKKAYAQGDGSAAYELGRIYFKQRSSSSAERARKYLADALSSRYIAEDERDDARSLLSQLKTKVRRRVRSG
ncbi:tetratricopeptide repeat protein [Ramlibacter albus]|uniref:Sel1 repeat family protein n=1 Tax=Ramlibacter albus TaxID=2079448 RepID=A0A923MG98_9BURK|nr:tetratricopeptide repeat protein [Ramlibacter albus]MBC5768704.1 sel1 repeat family protein [Ramlibacter albus]